MMIRLVKILFLSIVYLTSCQSSKERNHDEKPLIVNEDKGILVPPPPPYNWIHFLHLIGNPGILTPPECFSVYDSKLIEDCVRDHMMNFIKDNLEYPEEARVARLEGMCIVQFEVTFEGDIQDVNLVRDIGKGTGLASIDVVQKLKREAEKWIPSKTRYANHIFTINKKTYYSIPVQFRLSQKKD